MPLCDPFVTALSYPNDTKLCLWYQAWWIKRYDKELAEKTLKHTLFTINNKIKKEFYKKDFSIKFNIGNYKDYEKYLKLKVDKEDENKFLKKYFDIYKKI